MNTIVSVPSFYFVVKFSELEIGFFCRPSASAASPLALSLSQSLEVNIGV